MSGRARGVGARRATALLALLVALALASPVTAAASTGFEGTVTAPVGVEEVEVCVVEPLPSETCTYPAANGAYKLLGIPPGVYQVEFLPSYRSHLVAQYYNGKSRLTEANRVVVSTNAVTQHVDAQLQLGGEIEGTVSAAGGSGLPQVEVCAQDASTAAPVSCVHTGAGGGYALPSVPPGSYRVGFWGSGPSARFAPQYWQGQAAFFDADPIAVGAGATVPGIDAELGEGAELSGTVTSAVSGGPLAGISVCVLRVAGASPDLCSHTGPAGEYVLMGLAGGAYQVVFSPEFSEFAPGEFALPEADGWQTQYFAGAATRAASATLTVPAPQHREGLDAALLPTAVAPPAPAPEPAPNTAVPPPPVLPQPPPPEAKPRCKRGYVQRRVKGRKRCVAKRRHGHRRHARGLHRKGS